MKIIVPMAGEGSRFRRIGIDKPKHEIRVRDRTMFEWAMQSLDSFFDHEFIFITRSSHDARPFLKEKCANIGIHKYDVVTLDSLTSGQSATVMEANEHVCHNDSIAIYNIDTYIESGTLAQSHISGVGWIPVFEAPGERWSFAAIDDDNKVTAVSEKEKISDFATVGFYYFDAWNDFSRAYEKRADDIEREYGETYVAPLYNDLVERGELVRPYRIPASEVHVLGTPEDLLAFDPEFKARNGL